MDATSLDKVDLPKITAEQRAFLKSIADDKFLIVDKPPDIITHEISSFLGRLFGVKAGHSGTLDPDVSGVLLVGMGRATRLLQYLTEQDKTYIGLAEFPDEKDEGTVKEIFSKLTGVVEQIPPEKSAVVRRRRKRHVYSLDLLEMDTNPGRFALFRAFVEKGTYIRVLCEDMGGRMADLRRVSAGGISEEHALIMERILDAYTSYLCNDDSSLLEKYLKTPEWVFEHSSISKAYINDKAAEALLRGAPLYAPGIEKYIGEVKAGKWLAVFRHSDGRLIGVLKIHNDYNGEEKGLVAKGGRIHLKV